MSLYGPAVGVALSKEPRMTPYSVRNERYGERKQK
jgi:hypothetical protein